MSVYKERNTVFSKQFPVKVNNNIKVNVTDNL